jgi:ABC-type oligopeptide transport system substrate-binding subunit
MKRLIASAVMLALGVAFGVAAHALPNANGSVSRIREGGTFRVALHRIDFVDPAKAYFPISWVLLEATCAKLMNYPDRRLPDGQRAVSEVARRWTVSDNGKEYTFTLRRGFRFNTGARLDSRGFARAIERLLDPRLKSDGFGYALDIVGAAEFRAGKASTVSGVVARGNRLVIRLKRGVPDFPARLAMPFFCAVPPGLPVDPEGVKAYASAGPYYVSEYQPDRKVVLRENRFYGGERPHHVDRFEVELVGTPTVVVDRIERGAADWGLFPGVFRERGPGLVRKYGLERSRLFIRPSPSLQYFVLNTERPLFKNNARLRRAINFAVDRSALVGKHGYRTVRPTDQYLPIGFPGFKDAHIYPNQPNLKKARALARGRLRAGKAVLYTDNRPSAIALAQVMEQNLLRIGIDVEIKPFAPDVLFDKLSTRGEPFDIGWPVGWLTDYVDPYAFINVLLDGRRVGEANYSHFNSPRYNRRMRRASRLVGPARYRAYGNLDIALARDAAPMVAYASGNAVTFVSNRLDPRCRILRPELDLAAVCLKR